MHRFCVLAFQDLAIRRTKLAVSIHKHVQLAVQESIKGIGKIPGNLLHPLFIGARRKASEVNTPRGDLHDE
jgi:hypothetical protein